MEIRDCEKQFTVQPVSVRPTTMLRTRARERMTKHMESGVHRISISPWGPEEPKPDGRCSPSDHHRVKRIETERRRKRKKGGAELRVVTYPTGSILAVKDLREKSRPNMSF